MQAWVHYIALIVSLAPSSWAGFAMATIYDTKFALVGLGLSFVIPWFIVWWNVIDGMTSEASVPLSLTFSGLYGLCNYGAWAFIVHVEHLSIRNPKDWNGFAVLCLYQRIDISLGGAALGSMLAFIMQLVATRFPPAPGF